MTAPEGVIKRIITKVAEAAMPCVAGDGEEGLVLGRWRGHGVELIRRVTPEDHRLRASVLDRKTNVIKFHVNRVITG